MPWLLDSLLLGLTIGLLPQLVLWWHWRHRPDYPRIAVLLLLVGIGSRLLRRIVLPLLLTDGGLAGIAWINLGRAAGILLLGGSMAWWGRRHRSSPNAP